MNNEVIATIKEHFGQVRDPRQPGKVEHPLINIIFITICGVLCGANNWVAIEDFGNAQKEWLEQYLNLEKGIPSHDTLGSTFAVLDREQFSRGFLSWMQAVCELVAGIVAIDGKQLRRSHDKSVGKGAIHMVSAWGEANGLVLGQEKVAEKSNEITAIPLLLAALDLTGCIVTIDAMGCQREIAAQIDEQGGDYVLSLKDNQGHLYEDVQEMFAYFQKIDFVDVQHDYCQTVDKGHGRIEIRECWAFNPHEWQDYFRTLDKWQGLQSVAMIRAQRVSGDKTTVETRFVISSLTAQAKLILQAKRRHWGIENKLHWVLDVAFAEDLCRVRQGYAAENLAVIRHLVLNLLRQDKKSKLGIENKRLRCGWDARYRTQILKGITSLC
ncbi:MAG: ISAs1 family transposase [Ardenticatenaceae bacterium]|nr:ISAs1 family transposase [Ardenticatenaceae bacterium]